MRGLFGHKEPHHGVRNPLDESRSPPSSDLALCWSSSASSWSLSSGASSGSGHYGQLHRGRIIFFGYFFLLTATLGASLGKMALGMRVVDANGNKPAASAVFKREFVIRALGSFSAVILGSVIGRSGEEIGGAIGFAVFIVIAIMILLTRGGRACTTSSAGRLS